MKYYQTTYVNSLSLANSKVNNSKVFNLSLKSQVKPTSVQIASFVELSRSVWLR